MEELGGGTQGDRERMEKEEWRERKGRRRKENKEEENRALSFRALQTWELNMVEFGNCFNKLIQNFSSFFIHLTTVQAKFGVCIFYLFHLVHSSSSLPPT